MINHRRFTASLTESSANREPRLEIRVDDAPFLDLVREAEYPFATREGVPGLAGNYGWPALTPELLRLLAGERPGTQGLVGVLLNCECGWTSCWPLSIRVRMTDRFVLWQDLRQLKRPSTWRYDAIEPLRFARADYLEQLERVRDVLRQLSRAVEPRHLAGRTHPDDEAAACAI